MVCRSLGVLLVLPAAIAGLSQPCLADTVPKSAPFTYLALTGPQTEKDPADSSDKGTKAYSLNDHGQVLLSLASRADGIRKSLRFMMPVDISLIHLAPSI